MNLILLQKGQKFSILSNKKILEIFDFKIPPWKTALIDCLIDLRRY